jgi:hypothetical protein
VLLNRKRGDVTEGAARYFVPSRNVNHLTEAVDFPRQKYILAPNLFRSRNEFKISSYIGGNSGMVQFH